MKFVVFVFLETIVPLFAKILTNKARFSLKHLAGTKIGGLLINWTRFWCKHLAEI
jgi:hypothetical protein